jgi:hypothetical protein
VPLEELIRRPITGIRPFNELAVDAEIWREAHSHHHLHRRVHALAAHRPGIVTGLEVVASAARERTIHVAPGIGIDPDGQTVVLSEPVSFTLEEDRQIYLVLSFRSGPDRQSAVAVGGGQEYFREVESRELVTTRTLPKGPYLELARIFRSKPESAVRDAVNPFAPGNDELNLLYRPIAFPHCYADAIVGELPYVPKTNASPWNPHRAGLWNLLREGNGRGFHLAFAGPVNLRAELPATGGPTLLYVAGRQGFQPLADAEVDGLRRFLRAGSFLFGEAGQGSKEFAEGFAELAGRLGANLQQVKQGHALLAAHHVFPVPPAGAQSRGALSLDAEAGVLFGSYDYGAAWQGEIDHPDEGSARERVRQAQEFGLNVIAFAAQRLRRQQLAALD